MRTEQIGTEPLRLALPRDHRLSGRQRIRLKDVAKEPFIALRSTSALRKLAYDLCKQAGFRPTVVFEGDDLTNLRGLVAAGPGGGGGAGAAGGLVGGGGGRAGAIPGDRRYGGDAGDLPDLVGGAAAAAGGRVVPRARRQPGDRGEGTRASVVIAVLDSRWEWASSSSAGRVSLTPPLSDDLGGS